MLRIAAIVIATVSAPIFKSHDAFVASDARRFPLSTLLIGPKGNLLATATRLLPFATSALALLAFLGFKLLHEFFQQFFKALPSALRTTGTLTLLHSKFALQIFNLFPEVARATGLLTRIWTGKTTLGRTNSTYRHM
jgi:hypothetical protein